MQKSITDSSAFNAIANFVETTADPTFIVDSGASQDMVADKSLLTSLQSIATKSVVMAAEVDLFSKKLGDLHLSKLEFNVLFVLGLDRKFISVGSTPYTAN